MFFQPSRDETNREDVERIVPSYADEAGFNDATPKVSFANSAHAHSACSSLFLFRHHSTLSYETSLTLKFNFDSPPSGAENTQEGLSRKRIADEEDARARVSAFMSRIIRPCTHSTAMLPLSTHSSSIRTQTLSPFCLVFPKIRGMGHKKSLTAMHIYLFLCSMILLIAPIVLS